MNSVRMTALSRKLLCAYGLGLTLLLAGCQTTGVDPTSSASAEPREKPAAVEGPSLSESLIRASRVDSHDRRPARPIPTPIRRTIPACDGREFRLRDLEVETLRVANQDVDQLMQMLQMLGYETVQSPSALNTGPTGQAGVMPGGIPGSPQAGMPGVIPGSMQGGMPGVMPGSRQGGMPGVMPGSRQGVMPGSVPGAVQGGMHRNTQAGMPASASPGAVKRYGCESLPIILMPPPLNDDRLGFSAEDFLGLGGGASRGRGFSSGNVRGDISPALHPMSKPHTGEVDQLLVFYHPEQVDELRELESLVHKRLDVHSRQVYIEGMVLEISEDGLRELGIRYDRTDPASNNIYSLGALEASPVAAGGAKVLSFLRDNLLDPTLRSRSLLQIQALVSTGAAEVLSRPSVLTLSNRQATIQIIDIVQFPIQEATITASGDIVQSAFTFEAVRPGITLNLRPRVSANNEFVSLEIDVTVEALVSANNGEVRNDQGQVIATKPGSSARRVQTFARIPDRTPIIIGGLISADKENVTNRLPILGDIPFLGALFGATSKSFGKREVIIVLTPYVVGEDATQADVSVPKDTALFDTKDTTLFHDSYRVRSEDAYDLRFLLDSPEFTSRQRRSEQILERDPERARGAPFNQFLDGNIPGGEKFLNRMMFDLVRRRDFGSEITPEQLIVLRNDPSGDPEVSLISNLFAELNAAANKALVIVFGKDEQDGANPASELRIVELPEGQTWDELLWDLSYGAPDGIERGAIIVRNAADLAKLVDSTVSAAILDRNGAYDKLTVGRFRQGTMLSIPKFDSGRFYLVDDNVARVFTDVRHYYRAAGRARERTYREMDEVMAAEMNENYSTSPKPNSP